jgi:hypothetical protein
MKAGPSVTLAISFLLAVSTHSNAADVAEGREILSTAILLEEDLPPAEKIGLDNLEPLADLIRFRQIGNERPEKKLKPDRPVIVGLPLSEDDRIYRIDEPENESRPWSGDGVPEQLDREALASDADGVRIALTEWLACLVEITVPIRRDRAAEELGGAEQVDELRVFGALATSF